MEDVLETGTILPAWAPATGALDWPPLTLPSRVCGGGGPPPLARGQVCHLPPHGGEQCGQEEMQRWSWNQHLDKLVAPCTCTCTSPPQVHLLPLDRVRGEWEQLPIQEDLREAVQGGLARRPTYLARGFS